MKFLPDWFRRDRIDRDIDEELAFHVEAHARDLVSDGVPPEEARRRALAAFGGMAPIRELTRDARGGRWLEDLSSDLRYAVRSIRHQPGVAVVAIVTLTLGIGANTAIFSMVNGLLLRPLPVREPGRLVLFSDSASEGTQSSTPPPSGRWDLFSSEAYEYLRSQPLPLQSIGAFASGEQTVALGIPGQRANDLRALAHLVSGNYFEVIGAAPALGRVLSNDDDRPGAVPVAVASDRFWRQRLDADPAAAGRTITINGTTFGIVGVMPSEFFGERVRRSPDLWVPLAHQPQVQLRASAAARPELYWLSLFGRLGPSHTIAGAQAATTSALRQFLTASAGPQPSENDRQRIASVRVQMVSGARGISVTRNQNTKLLVLLLSAVGVILLIACSNVGTLFLARAVTRQREIAVRRALGASRGRLIRQWLTESLLMAGLGAVGGGIVARFAAPPLFATFVAASNPAKATIDGVVLAFTTGAALLSSLIFGLAPALRAGGVDPLATLRAAGSPASRRRGRRNRPVRHCPDCDVRDARGRRGAARAYPDQPGARAPWIRSGSHPARQPQRPHSRRRRRRRARHRRTTGGARSLESRVRADSRAAGRRERDARAIQPVRRLEQLQQPGDRGLRPRPGRASLRGDDRCGCRTIRRRWACP